MSELLSADVERYCLAAGIEHVTALQYRKSVSCLSEFLHRPAIRADLNEETINAWLASVAQRLSACTAHNRKRGITPLWNWLAAAGAVDWYNPRALRKIRIAKRPPAPWSVLQVQQLLLGADDLTGRLQCGIPASDLMEGWIRVAYESALRPSDLYRIRWEDLEGNRIAIAQHKTGGPHTIALSDLAVRSIERLKPSGSRTIFILKKSGLRRWELKLFEAAAAHGFTRRVGQSTGTLRKTSATEVARVEGIEAAANHLGHRSGAAVTRDYYVGHDAIRRTEPPRALIDALECAGHRVARGCAS